MNPIIKRSLLLLFTMNLLAGHGNCQNYTVRNYTTNQGLPHNNVRAIVQDSTGYLWLATWDGLSRFDGYDFKNYFHEAADPSSLPYFSIYNLCIDRYNNLWILPDNSTVVKYNRTADNFTSITSVNKITGEKLIGFASDQSGLFYLLTENSIIRWDEKYQTGELFRLQDKTGNPVKIEYYVNSLIFTDNNELWMPAFSRVLRFRETDKGIFALEKEYPILKRPLPKTIDFDYKIWQTIYNSESGRKWIFSNEGLYKLNESSDIFTEITSGFPVDEFKGSKFFCWASPDYGAFIYNADKKVLSNIPSDRLKFPLSVLPVDQHSVWFSNTTYSGVSRGVSHLIYIPGFFKNMLFNDADSAAPALYSVIMDKDKNIWAGIRGYDHIIKVGNDNKISQIGKISKELESRSGHIRSMIPVSDGIWIGYYVDLLRFYSYKTGKFTDYLMRNAGFRAIYPDDKKTIYVGRSDLTVFHPESGRFDTIWHSQTGDGMFKLHKAGDSLIFAGMANSMLLMCNLKNGKSDLIHLPNNTTNVEDLIDGSEGELWLALLGEGVCRYNYINGKAEYYTTANGLSNNTTYNLLKDKAGNIWVSTNNGISRINPETGLIRRFGRTDGVEIIEFNSGAKFEADDGEFIFGGMGGYVRFYPDSIKMEEENKNRFRIILTGFDVSGETKQLTKPLDSSDTISLAKGENNFHLSFSTNDFADVNKTLFRYRLSGIDQDWIQTGPENRNINYSNLSPGWYTLEIQATDAERRWTMSKALVLRLHPYFYQTLLFLICVPLLILSIVVFTILIYIRQIKQRARQIQDELKLQALRGQMNPHFIFNSLNSINYFISNNDKISANRYISDFSRLIRTILSNLGTDYVRLDGELDTLREYLNIEHLRFGDKFDYELETNDLPDSPDMEVFPGLLQPFIENAIWHGVRLLEDRKGFIRIRFSFIDLYRIKCVIEDDGVGRVISMRRKSVNNDHKSRGIEIVMERLQLISKLRGINYEIVIRDLFPDKPETGTRVEIDIPVR